MRHYLLVSSAGHIFQFTSFRNIRAPHTKMTKRLAAPGAEINGIVRMSRSVSPSASIRRTFHPAFQRRVIYQFDILQNGGAAYPPGKIDLDPGGLRRREGKSHDAAVWCGRHLASDRSSL